jgi:DNA-directed RNA polymerase subunit RPC12/RpoP
MRIVKTFESFMADDEGLFEPHRSQEMEMPQHAAGQIDHEKHHEVENYMMFGNLETIKRLAEELLKMDPAKIDMILKNGHNWAVDHVATSKDDIEEVFNFLKNEMTEGPIEESMDEKKYSCNECGMAYEKANMPETMVCESCGGRIDEDVVEPKTPEETAMQESYKCNECGVAYEAELVQEGENCACGGTIVKENWK